MKIQLRILFYKDLFTLHNNVGYITLPQLFDENSTAIKITEFYYLIFLQPLDFHQTVMKKLCTLHSYIIM